MTNYSLILARNFSVNFTKRLLKLQNCNGNVYLSVKMASRFKDVTDEEITVLKDAAENVNTRKSTINWVRVFET